MAKIKVTLTERETEILLRLLDDLEACIEDGDEPTVKPEEAGELIAKIRAAQEQ